MGCALCVVSNTGFIKRNKTWGTSDLFGEIRQPATDYVVTPRHVSETRKYWTAQTNSPSVIRGDANMLVSDPRRATIRLHFFIDVHHLAKNSRRKNQIGLSFLQHPDVEHLPRPRTR